jgi:hypothetical protein
MGAILSGTKFAAKIVTGDLGVGPLPHQFDCGVTKDSLSGF